MRSLVALGSAALLIVGAAACSGGGGSGSPFSGHPGSNTSGGNGSTSSGSQQTTAVRISIPSASSTNSKLRRAKYVSSSTNGGTLTVYSALATPPPSPSVVIDLSSKSTACTTNSDGSRSCTISVSAPVGQDNFVFNAYDQAPVNGSIPATAKLLSTSTVAYNVALGASAPVLSLTLNGVAATLAIAPSPLAIPLTGTSTFAITVDALDADGNYIVGPGGYVDANGNPVTINLIKSGDTSNEFALSATSVTTPGTTITATYNGGGSSENITITASANGFTDVSLTAQIMNTQTVALANVASPTPSPTPTATPPQAATATPTATSTASATASATATPAPTATPTAAPTVVANLGWYFNHTKIASGNTLWFTSFITPSGVSTSSPVVVNMTNATIQFASGGTSYRVYVPNFTLTFNPAATDSIVSYDLTTNSWNETVPSTYTGETLVGAVEFPVTATLASAINPVTWTATFTTTQRNGLTLQWAWRAGVYPDSTFSSDYNALGVKPVAASTLAYPNTDKAGTPETYKADVIKGGTGNGGADYIGSSGQSNSTPVTATYSP